MRPLWVASLVVMSLTGTAGAAEHKDPLADFYANTWNAYSSEGVNHYLVNKDHTWRGETHDKRNPAGTWYIAGKKVCFRGPGPEECFDILGKKVNQTWLMSDDGKEVVSVLHKGRE